MKNEYKGHTYIHKVKIKITNEIFTCVRLSKTPFRGGDRGGEGRKMDFVQSNLLLDLIKFIVCKIMFLLSSSARSLWPYKNKSTSFCKKARLLTVRSGITFCAKIILFELWNGHFNMKCSVVSTPVLHRHVSVGVSRKLCFSYGVEEDSNLV